MTNGEIILKLIKDVTGIELELGAEFSLVKGDFTITQEGLYSINANSDSILSLNEFIGYLPTIKIKNKFPKNGTNYYYISPQNEIISSEFNRVYTIDILNYKIGNFFLTYEEAEQNKEKIMKILNSPEKFKECN